MNKHTHLHSILIGVVFLTLKLGIAEATQIQTPPPPNAPRTAKITKLGEKSLRFTYEGQEKLDSPDGKKRVVLSQFKDATGKVAYRQELRYEISNIVPTALQSRMTLISFVLVDEQRGRTYRITAEDKKLRYAVQETPGGEFKLKAEEKLLAEHVAGPLVPLRLEEAFPILLTAPKNTQTRIKLAVPDQSDSFTFVISLKKKGGNGKPATLLMKVKNPVIGLIVKPLEFDFNPETGVMLGSRGRTFLEIKSIDPKTKQEKFEAFNAEMKFD